MNFPGSRQAVRNNAASTAVVFERATSVRTCYSARQASSNGSVKGKLNVTVVTLVHCCHGYELWLCNGPVGGKGLFVWFNAVNASWLMEAEKFDNENTVTILSKRCVFRCPGILILLVLGDCNLNVIYLELKVYQISQLQMFFWLYVFRFLVDC